MSGHRIHHQGLYAFVPEADDYVAVEVGDRVVASVGTGVGCQYAVSDKGGPVRVVESMYLDGASLAQDEEVHEPGEGHLMVWSFEDDAELVPGTYRFQVSFPDDPDAEPLVADVAVSFAPAPPEADAPVLLTHIGTFRFDPDDGSLQPHLLGAEVNLRDPLVTSFGVRVDLKGGWPVGTVMTTLFEVTAPDGETVAQPVRLTGPRVLSWPAADAGTFRVTLSFPRNPSAEDRALRFVAKDAP